MQPGDKRKSLRRKVSYPAWIELGDGSPPRRCVLLDISQHGAQLTVGESDPVPEKFTLALSTDGAASRRCRVVWRAGNQIGVEFLKNLQKKNQDGMPSRSWVDSWIGGASESSVQPDGAVPASLEPVDSSEH